MFRVQSGGRMIKRPHQAEGKAKLPEAEIQAGKETISPAQAPSPERLPSAPMPTLTLPASPPASGSPNGVPSVTPEEARQMFRRGDTPRALIVNGSLNLSGSAWLRTLPEWLRCAALIVDDCPHLSVLPSDLHADRLSARRCPQVREVVGRLSVRETVNLSGSGVRLIQADLHAGRLQLARCRDLTGIRGMVSVSHLDVRGCVALTALDSGLHVAQTIDVADSGLRGLPPHIRAGLRWNDVPVDARVAFTPEQLSGREIMQLRNVQRRRVLLERIGIEKFLADVGGLVLDRDRDAGGERSLIRVPFDDDEDLVAVLVKCPSTGGSYALRVPPSIRTCREALAWTAGLSVSEYHPVQEA